MTMTQQELESHLSPYKAEIINKGVDREVKEHIALKSSPEDQKGSFLRLKDFPSPITPPNKENPSYRLL